MYYDSQSQHSNNNTGCGSVVASCRLVFPATEERSKEMAVWKEGCHHDCKGHVCLLPTRMDARYIVHVCMTDDTAEPCGSLYIRTYRRSGLSLAVFEGDFTDSLACTLICNGTLTRLSRDDQGLDHIPLVFDSNAAVTAQRDIAAAMHTEQQRDINQSTVLSVNLSSSVTSPVPCLDHGGIWDDMYHPLPPTMIISSMMTGCGVCICTEVHEEDILARVSRVTTRAPPRGTACASATAVSTRGCSRVVVTQEGRKNNIRK